MDKRYIAKIIIEAATPLSIGSGQSGLLIDRMIAKDANDLPYIPGTSLAGVLRHSFKELGFEDNEIFGFGGDNGEGSRVLISAAHLIGADGKTVMEGLKHINFEQGYYSYFNRLPERDHVRMNEKGAADAEGHGKYDEQLVHKGTRFAFEIELKGTDADAKDWQQLLDIFASSSFRIGAGTRKGFGKIKIVAAQSRVFDLKNETDLLAYINKSSSLNSDTSWSPISLTSETKLEHWHKYAITLTAKDFFLFSAGFGDEDADAKPKTEQFFDWSNGKPTLIAQEHLLIPATSIKGALAHRVAYHYNLLNQNFIGKNTNIDIHTAFDLEKVLNDFDMDLEQMTAFLSSDSREWANLEQKIKGFTIEDSSRYFQRYEEDLSEEFSKIPDYRSPVMEYNDAVRILFGFAKDSEIHQNGKRGNVIIDDIYLPLQNTKVFNHVKIDRFTNGVIDGALFQEKVANYDASFNLEILVHKNAFENENIKIAFENTLDDLINGRLQLGGNTTKGHGIFVGQLQNS